jgi:molybdate transport system substrate-binding protein
MQRRTLLALAAVTLGRDLVACTKPRAAANDTEVLVAAATSLRKVMPALGEAFSAAHPGTRVVATFGASGDLCKQVEGGAKVDLVLFAAADPVDRLIRGGHVDAATRRVVATNELILIGPRGGPALTFRGLDALPRGERLAIGEPSAVPAGKYAQEALVALGLWSKLEGRVVHGGNVAAVLAYVERGEVPAAIVYRTEIEGVKGVQVLDVAKGEWAPRPEVVAGVAENGRARGEVAGFLNFVASADGRRIFAAHGFGLPS